MSNFAAFFKQKKEEILEGVAEAAASKMDEKVDPNVRDSRLAVCNACEFMLLTGNCMKCGCFMRAKSWMKTKKCPVGKW